VPPADLRRRRARRARDTAGLSRSDVCHEQDHQAGRQGSNHRGISRFACGEPECVSSTAASAIKTTAPSVVVMCSLRKYRM
jgi:hypothetical protein